MGRDRILRVERQDPRLSRFKTLSEQGMWVSTGKLVWFRNRDQLEQATKQTAAEIEEMRLQEPSMGSSDGNDDSMSFFRDFFEGKGHGSARGRGE